MLSIAIHVLQPILNICYLVVAQEHLSAGNRSQGLMIHDLKIGITFFCSHGPQSRVKGKETV